MEENIKRTYYRYCLHCGKLITSKRFKYCSDKCSWRYALKKNREEKIDELLRDEFEEKLYTG